jgi:ATP-dependent Clp protease ATP-binding subunit ClpC
MFERFTEKARRVIFFGRYEASQFGSPYIETERLLLGLLREDKGLNRRFLPPSALDRIRLEIERTAVTREKGSTSVDLPLSNESKRVLAYASEEAERLNHNHIGTEHLLLGLLREEKSVAARALQTCGLTLEKVREELGRTPHEPPAREVPSPTPPSTLARANLIPLESLFPLIGRETELERILQIMGCYNARNPVLVGEPGVGKRTIVGGLAQRITDGVTPLPPADCSTVELDLPPWGAISSTWFEKFHFGLSGAAEQGIVLFVDDLHTPADTLFGRTAIHLQEILKRVVVSGKIHCISLTTQAAYDKSIADHGWLETCFQPVRIAPATEAESLQVLAGIKHIYEEFHSIRYTDDALATAVAGAAACIPARSLPGKAVDVMDEAGCVLRLRNSRVPTEIVEVQKRLRFIVTRRNAAIENHEFEKARFYSGEEQNERKTMAALLEEYRKSNPLVPEVTADDVVGVIARWTGATVDAIRKAISKKRDGEDEKK